MTHEYVTKDKFRDLADSLSGYFKIEYDELAEHLLNVANKRATLVKCKWWYDISEDARKHICVGICHKIRKEMTKKLKNELTDVLTTFYNRIIEDVITEAVSKVLEIESIKTPRSNIKRSVKV